jgi:2'-5' RNA ligase
VTGWDSQDVPDSGETDQGDVRGGWATALKRDGDPARVIGVAIPIPDPYGTQLQRTRAALGDPMAHAIPTHITLLPPTEVPGGHGALVGVEDHLRGVARSEHPFGIRLRGTATFRPVSPVVFIALAEGIADCERLQQRVLAGPLARELEFPYHPHVTVAHHLPDEVMDRAYKDLSGYEASFEVRGFSLYEHGMDGVWRPRRHFGFASVPPAAGATATG